MSQSNRNQGLDMIKGLCCFMIVCVHTPFPEIIGGYWDAICKIAVPIFFMITGYYYDGISQKTREWRQIRKVVFLLCWSNVIYFIWNFIWAINGNSVEEYLSTFRSIAALWSKKISSGAVISGHLWYIAALLLVLLIVWVLDKFQMRKKMYAFIIPLYLMGIMLGKYSVAVFGVRFPIVYSRNFLFTGMTFFLFGNLVYQIRETKIYRVIKMNSTVFMSGLLILLFFEKWLLQRLQIEANGDLYLIDGILAFVVFIVFNGALAHNRIDWYLAYLGKTHSTNIYIIHYMILSFLNMVISKLYGNEQPVLVGVVKPFAVFIAALVCSIVIVKMSTVCRRKANV